MKQLLLTYIKKLAHYRVTAAAPEIVGVTGSLGKSSFVYLLDAVMKTDRPTKTTFKGNSESGLPLEILDLRQELDRFSLPWMNWASIAIQAPFQALRPLRSQLLIAEMGIDSTRPPQNMEYLLEIVQPDIGVFLSVAPAHTQQFSEELNLAATDTEAILRAIAQEKGKLVTRLPATAKAIVNIDSPYIQELVPQIQAEVVSFAWDQAADYRVVSHQVDLTGTRFVFQYRQKKEKLSLEISGFALSREYGLTLAAVIATAHELGVSFPDILHRLSQNFRLPYGRMSLLAGRNKTHILDSSYNSSPAALRSILETAEKIKTPGRKILVLGDMRELGPLEKEAHRQLADIIAQVGDEVVLVGPKMREYVLPILQKKKVSVYSVLSSQGLGEEMLRVGLVKSGDLLVIKGSQNTIFLEQTVKELLAHSGDAHKLCRQEAQWVPIRQKFWATTEPVSLQ